MKLAQQDDIKEHQQNDKIPQVDKLKDQMSFLQPFLTFQFSVTISILIHFVRFIFVSLIYYFSDNLIHSSKGSSQPWNSLIYLLAMMIEIIKFTGDCSLRNLLKIERKKLIQIHNIESKSRLNSENNHNVILKGGKYEEYMDLFSIVRNLKYKHKNYSSAFVMSKQLHLVCTFLLFGFMSFREQTFQSADWKQFLILGIFLYSIYFTSFEMDLFMIETSSGCNLMQKTNQLQKLTQMQVKTIGKQFYDWRSQHSFFCIIGSVFILVAVLFHFTLGYLMIAAIVQLSVNFLSILIQDKIQASKKVVIPQMKRSQINTYSVLKKSTEQFSLSFKAFIILERASLLWFCFFFAKQVGLSWPSFLLYVFGILFLINAQIKKFKRGNKLRLLTILQETYSKKITQPFQNDLILQCSICLNSFQQGQKIKLLPCSKDHIYHKNCFQDWTKIKKQCPLCRYSLEEYI